MFGGGGWTAWLGFGCGGGGGEAVGSGMVRRVTPILGSATGGCGDEVCIVFTESGVAVASNRRREAGDKNF